MYIIKVETSYNASNKESYNTLSFLRYLGQAFLFLSKKENACIQLLIDKKRIFQVVTSRDHGTVVMFRVKSGQSSVPFQFAGFIRPVSGNKRQCLKEKLTYANFESNLKRTTAFFGLHIEFISTELELKIIQHQSTLHMTDGNHRKREWNKNTPKIQKTKLT